MINQKQKYKKYYDGMPLSDYDISSEIDFVIEMLTGLSSMDILLGKKISSDDDEKICEVLKIRTETNKPIQQIIGKAYFAGQKSLDETADIIQNRVKTYVNENR